MLRQALNALTSLHSRPGTLKRLGTADMYSPCQLTPSNYFRFLRGPEYTTIKGVEFVIPIDTMLGEFAQVLTFSTIPDEGTFKLSFGGVETAAMAFNVSATNMQIQIRTIPAYPNALVTGSFLVGFTIVFRGIAAAPALGSVVSSSLEAANVAVTSTWASSNIGWTEPLKRGDRIIDGSSLWSIDEIIIMHDLGATPMAYRVRAD